MPDPRVLLAQAAEPHPLVNLVPFALMAAIFYFLVLQPARSKQKKLDELVKNLKPGDRIIVNPGIFGTVVAVEEHALVVRVDEKARIKVLKSAVSGLEGQPTENK